MKKLLLSGAALLLSTGIAGAQTLEEIVVTGSRSYPMAKLDQPILSTPQSIAVVPPEVLHEQAVTSLHEALLNVPGATAHADEDSQQGDNFFIRGFSAKNDIYLDGIRDPGYYKRDAFDMEALEVLEGPSSVAFGRGSTGGAINYVTKAPQLEPITAATLMFGTDATKRATADLDLPIGPETAVRLNLVGHDAGFAGRDVVEYSRVGAAPSISFGIGTDTRLTAELFHESEYDVPDYGVPWLYSPGNVRPYYTSNFYGREHSDFVRSNADIVTLFGEHDLNDWLTLRDRFRWGSYERAMQVTEPAVEDLVTGPLSRVLVDPVTRGVRSRETTVQNQTDVRAKFEMGPVSEDLIAGVEYARDTTTPTTFKFSGVPEINLLSPNPSRPFVGTRSLKSDVNSSAIDQAVYAISTTTWNNWSLNLAARFDRFAAAYNQSVPPVQHFNHTDKIPSFRGAVVYHPVDEASLYFSYGTSFDPSAEALSLSTATAALAAQKTRAVEVGAKYAPHPGLLATVALFRTLQYNLTEPDPLDPTTDILIGAARAEGVDVSLQGEVADNWKVWAGYEYLLATVTSSPNGDVGNRLQQAPRHSARLWTSYEMLSNKFEIGVGVNYIGNRTPTTLVEAFNIMQVAPSYWTVGLMAGYRVNDNLRLQFNIDNLNGSRYFDGIDDNHVNPGEGRVAYFTMRYKM